MKIVNGTSYNQNTPDKVIEVLETCRANNTRIILEYGNINTGQGWGDTYGVTGRIGRSTGINKIPLMIATKRSLGGGAILDNCIVSIKTTIGKVSLYSHVSYKTGRKM